jgi:hypothetical protein
MGDNNSTIFRDQSLSRNIYSDYNSNHDSTNFLGNISSFNNTISPNQVAQQSSSSSTFNRNNYNPNNVLFDQSFDNTNTFNHYNISNTSVVLNTTSMSMSTSDSEQEYNLRACGELLDNSNNGELSMSFPRDFDEKDDDGNS